MPSIHQPIKTAAAVIHQGGVIAYPTEGVFGLGCDPFNADAVSRILSIKKRPVEKGLILISDNIARLEPYLEALTATQRATLETHWPGPFTFVIPHNGQLPDWITGGRESVAVRVTSHPLANALCEQIQMPLVSTSANRSGKPALETNLQVRAVLGNEVDYIVKGRVLKPGQSSRITHLISGQTFRA